MAATEKFIEQIVRTSARTQWSVYPECLFFGISKPYVYRHTSVERQAAVISCSIGSVVLYQLFVGDTYETTGMLGSYTAVHHPRPLEQSPIEIPGLVTGESAQIDIAGAVTVSLKGEELVANSYYREQLGINLALLTLEC